MKRNRGVGWLIAAEFGGTLLGALLLTGWGTTGIGWGMIGAAIVLLLIPFVWLVISWRPLTMPPVGNNPSTDATRRGPSPDR
jgi:hypothetical protein